MAANYVENDDDTPLSNNTDDSQPITLPAAVFAADGESFSASDSDNAIGLRGSASVAREGSGAHYDISGGWLSLGKNEALFDKSELSIFFDIQTHSEQQGTVSLLSNHMKYAIDLVNGDTLRFSFFEGATHRIEVRDLDLSSQDWNNIGFSFDTETGSFTAYLNGEVIKTASLDGVEIGEASYWEVMLGGTPWTQSLDGAIDNFTVYDYALDEGQVKTHIETISDDFWGVS